MSVSLLCEALSGCEWPNGQIDRATEQIWTMPFRDLSLLRCPLYDDFRGLPQVDFQRVGRKLASACLPNGRIDHGVIER